MTDELKKFPTASVVALIINQAGKILFLRSPKWKDLLVLVGGRVEWGETAVDAIKREVKEEAGLSVDVTFLKIVDHIAPVDYYKQDVHYLAAIFVARVNTPEDAVVVDNREASEYLWLTAEEIKQRTDIEKTTRDIIEAYQSQQAVSGSAEEYKSAWQRALADYKNLQKETQDRRAEWVSMSEQQIVEEFIPVYDNFKKAFAHHPELKSSDENNKQIQNWINGIGYIQKQFQEVMKNHNVEEIKTVGEMFDPRRHETVGEEESDKPHGTILKEADGGYTMGARVIKVAKVIIAK